MEKEKEQEKPTTPSIFKFESEIQNEPIVPDQQNDGNNMNKEIFGGYGLGDFDEDDPKQEYDAQKSTLNERKTRLERRLKKRLKKYRGYLPVVYCPTKNILN